MDIASRNIEEVTTARWFVMRAYKSEKRAEEKLKGRDGLEFFRNFIETGPMELRRKIFLLMLACVCCLNDSHAQHAVSDLSLRRDTSAIIRLYFRFDRSLLEKKYLTNEESLAKLDTMLNRPEVRDNLDSIVIIASASPEGMLGRNIKLAEERARATRTYVYWKHPDIVRERVQIYSIGEDWAGLAQRIADDDRCPHRARVLEIINSDVNSATKEWRLKQVGDGAAWRHIVNNHLRYLRAGATCIIVFQSVPHAPEPTVEPEPESEPGPVVEPDTVQMPAPQPVPESPAMEPTFVRQPLLAVKSNLLFDLASALNVELEVPMGKRWSVAGEWMFPWWRSNKSDLTMQLLAGHGEIRYWLGDRAKRDVMTGWHLGLYGGGGKFDFQVFNDDGSQGDFFDAGLSLGYAHRIGRSRSLRMEYTLGVGYLRSNYEAYDRVRDTKYGDIKVVRYPWETRRLNWIGPTRARISLVWLLHYRKKEVAK